MMLLTLVCACAGSTSGGMKVIRWLIVLRQGVTELKRLVHPSAEIPVKLGGSPVPAHIIMGVAGFFAMYFIVFAALMFLLMMFGLDQVTAWSAIATCINNVGPGLGEVAVDLHATSPIPPSGSARSRCSSGRVEIFTFVLLLTPAFWKK